MMDVKKNQQELEHYNDFQEACDGGMLNDVKARAFAQTFSSAFTSLIKAVETTKTLLKLKRLSADVMQ